MSATVQAATPQTIPVPADFPVRWGPGEELLFWERERTHYPRQILPLEEELLAAGDGFSHCARTYEMPIRGLEVRVHHGYVYGAIVPVIAAPQELEELGRRCGARMAPVMARVGELWEDRWLPEIVEHLSAMLAIHPEHATTAELLDHFDDAQARMRRLWELHFEIVFPAYLAVSEFDELYRELFDDADVFDSYRLLQGIESKTTEVGSDLFRLSRRALASPTVSAILESAAAADIPCKLAHSVDGLAFLAALDEHLAAYGHRGHTWGLATPTFIEDPTPVIKVLKDYLGQPDRVDPARELERLATEREAAVADARGRLHGYPTPIVEQFEAMLAAAQVGLRLTEDHGFYIDGYAVSCVRGLLMEIGRRLTAAGTLGLPDDVLLLRCAEIRNAAGGRVDGHARCLVERRRAELERYAEVSAPFALGTPPPGPPPVSPITRLVSKFGGPAAAQPEEPGVVRGASGSAGKAKGTARIVRSLDDAVTLRPGDILVAETTAPPWTPLFAVAAAVVTDTGGILSHCAVVAREYAIPAVVGTVHATAAIQDGDLVEVDGDAGTVRVIA